jgi:uncharacterized integral membrane protein
MVRLILAVILTILVVLFAMSNTHPVMLSFVVGPPVKVRLIFLLMSAFLVGMLFSGFAAMLHQLRMRRLARATMPAEPSPEGELVKS